MFICNAWNVNRKLSMRKIGTYRTTVRLIRIIASSGAAERIDMRRVILYVSVATMAFIVGVAVNWSMNTFGGFAVDRIYYDAGVDLKTSTILPDAGSNALSVHSCRQLVVSVTADGALNLNTMPTGTLNDTSALTAKLRTIFERREELQVFLVSTELSSAVPERRQIDKAVYIKVPRGVSYGEVSDLLASIKGAGADPVGLIADCTSHKP